MWWLPRFQSPKRWLCVGTVPGPAAPCAQRGAVRKRAGSPLPSLTASCAARARGFVREGCGRVGVTWWRWDRTSPGEALSPWPQMQRELSDSKREVSALPPHPSAPVLSPPVRILPAGLKPKACAPPPPCLSCPSGAAGTRHPPAQGGCALPHPHPARARGVHGGGFGTRHGERSPAAPGQGYWLFLAVDVIDAVLAGGSHWRAVLPTHYI